MKRGSLKYLTKEGLRNVWANRLMSAASVAVLLACLVIVGCATMVFLNISVVLDRVEDQNVVMAFIADGADQTTIDQVGSDLRVLDNVKEIQFVSKEEGYPEAISSFGADASIFEGMENPLPDAYKITVADQGMFTQTVDQIRSVTNVQSVRENSDIAGMLTKISQALTTVSIVIIAMLLLVSLFIIANTVRVTMYSRRLEISIMKSVGATRWFIRWPFMIEGIVLGILSGLISLLLVWGIYSAAVKAFGSMLVMIGGTVVPFGGYWWQMLLSFIGIGVLTGVFGSFVSMNKYLKEADSDGGEL